eukprot:CAMPEP_0178417230 /NCGR_PEP_ID=MMETSP0689_2-20121128/24468_1 /TAXON_ID=160604 /ORGANISM="Amphidinium massartii, Strain CS-259" /LENGTH=610 /DNA_ID=CAMNT_0020038591 /DNA_START=110 /DNA_END=1942 /DNA_ORIENTATION=-
MSQSQSQGTWTVEPLAPGSGSENGSELEDLSNDELRNLLSKSIADPAAADSTTRAAGARERETKDDGSDGTSSPEPAVEVSDESDESCSAESEESERSADSPSDDDEAEAEDDGRDVGSGGTSGVTAPQLAEQATESAPAAAAAAAATAAVGTAGQTQADEEDDSDDSDESESSEEQVINGHRAGKMVANIQRCQTICTRLLSQDVVAVDIEGVGLGRTGEICIVQVADRQGRIYLFDVTTLGKTVFASGLKALLESEKVVKLFYDLRADTDALWHLHKVLPKNLLDMQVLAHKAVCGSSQYVLGLAKALEYILPYQKKQASKGLKEAGQRLFAPNLGGRLEVWRQRPLPMILRCYCSVDVVHLFDMLRQWSKHMSLAMLRRISEARMKKHITSTKPIEGVQRRFKDFTLPKDHHTSAGSVVKSANGPVARTTRPSLTVRAASTPAARTPASSSTAPVAVAAKPRSGSTPPSTVVARSGSAPSATSLARPGSTPAATVAATVVARPGSTPAATVAATVVARPGSTPPSAVSAQTPVARSLSTASQGSNAATQARSVANTASVAAAGVARSAGAGALEPPAKRLRPTMPQPAEAGPSSELSRPPGDLGKFN